MSQNIAGQRAFSLLEVCRSIEKTIHARYGSEFWVKAEINKLNHYPHSGHAYPELVDKKNNVVQAEMRSVIWASNFNSINERFVQLLGEPLKDGIEVLFLAKVDYNAKYGLSLHILDIDASYTLGELQKEKQDSIRKLKQEGLFEANKKLDLALLPQRIAVISVETSKGYSDFIKVIDENNFGYRFFHMLFPALLQGEKATSSIKMQLARIEKVKKHFDVVCIIRGGGGDVGLSSFNNYELSKAVASFPLPVLSGIGHSTNETVTEMVSFRSAITPTELGDFLLQQFHNFAVPVKDAQNIILKRPKYILAEEQLRFDKLSRQLRIGVQSRLKEERSGLNHRMAGFKQQVSFATSNAKAELIRSVEFFKKASQEQKNEASEAIADLIYRLKRDVTRGLESQVQKLDHFSTLLKFADPVNTLKMGFSLTRKDGKLIKSADDLKKGDKIETEFAEGKRISEIRD